MSVIAPRQPLMIAGLLLVAAFNALGGDVKVIANTSVKADSISVEELRRLFLLQRKMLNDGSPVFPVLEKGGAVHEAFLRQYLERDASELRIYYQGLVFTGKGSMPKELNSDADVVAFVIRMPGAIGYVDRNSNSERAKVLTVVSAGHPPERTLLLRVTPEYPDTLRQLHIGGTVRLALTIAPNGTVQEVIVLGGNPILSEAAEKAAQQWVYAPAPSQTKVEVSIPFPPTP